MLIDLHAHTGGISRCCKISAEPSFRMAKNFGFDGLCITNHYDAEYFTDETYDAWLERYIAEWDLCRELGKRYGLRIFCGVEVTVAAVPKLHMLLYGADETFLRQNPKLCFLSEKELYDLAHSHGCAVVQAHPFRGGVGIRDTANMDGLEINCHPKYKNSFSREVMAAASACGLAVTCGCDYHADTWRPRGGTFLPETVRTEKDLAHYLLHASEFSLQLHELSSGAVMPAVYRR